MHSGNLFQVLFLHHYQTLRNILVRLRTHQTAALQNETALGPDETRIIKGVCPDGWHIPSQKEWQKLSQYVLDSGIIHIVVEARAFARAVSST